MGWHDLVADESHPEDPNSVEEFAAAVAAWLEAQTTTGASEPAESSEPAEALSEPAEPSGGPFATPSGGPLPTPPGGPLAMPPDVVGAAAAADEPEIEDPVVLAEEAEWDDLAARLPGAAAREQAVALREAAPVKTFITRALRMKTDERAWRIGADGEEKVAARLARLAKKDPSWRFVHAIPVGENGSDIDHLVVGPGGVFTLNAKHHPGANIWVGGTTFMVNGHRQPYIRNSRHESQRAAKLLSKVIGRPITVTGVIVPVGASQVTIKTAPEDVRVVNRMALPDWLRKRPVVLSDIDIAAIYEAARRSTTWQVAPTRTRAEGPRSGRK